MGMKQGEVAIGMLLITGRADDGGVAPGAETSNRLARPRDKWPSNRVPQRRDISVGWSLVAVLLQCASVEVCQCREFFC